MTWSFLSRKNLSQKKKILRENSNEDAVHQHAGRFHSFSWTVAKTGNERLIGDVGISPERA